MMPTNNVHILINKCFIAKEKANRHLSFEQVIITDHRYIIICIRYNNNVKVYSILTINENVPQKHKVSKWFWKNGADRLTQRRAAQTFGL